MLPRELGGVVDRTLKIYGTANVRVVDALVMSHLMSGHPAAAVYALAEKAADIIKEVLATATCPAGEAAFAIVGAGRQPARGCPNIENGITFNLALIKGINIKESYVSIGASETCGFVYDKLEGRGLACAASRSAKGGFAGFALSGITKTHVATLDIVTEISQVVNYEVALALGAIVNTNETKNPDLLRTLRGGGNNFGVVTRSNSPDQVRALVHELQKPDASPHTHLMISFGFAAAFGSEPFAINQIYSTNGVERPDVLEPFMNMEPQLSNTLRTHGIVEAANEKAGEITIPARSVYMNTHVKADIDAITSGSDIWAQSLEPLKNIEGLICSYTLQSYPQSLLEASAKNGGNSLGLTPDGGAIVSIALLAYWVNPGDDEKIVGALETMIEKLDENSTARGTFVLFKYLNYSFNSQDPLGSYGFKNTTQLQATNKKYGPEGILQKGVPGGWKLFY
ncbi:hypothetical protein O1611_g5737 [Lasiodiplodia mahajangana]|uniref:Uncharacterized protein n=1 Tax=Lasiodiplodia mahajangana TaxID=1108764 RepID=A0ACC2JK36_9PEZI|nr:hypothetical protein O1611_g5737 [Lasiodiplodia mahajangana]